MIFYINLFITRFLGIVDPSVPYKKELNRKIIKDFLLFLGFDIDKKADQKYYSLLASFILRIIWNKIYK